MPAKSKSIKYRSRKSKLVKSRVNFVKTLRWFLVFIVIIIVFIIAFFGIYGERRSRMDIVTNDSENTIIASFDFDRNELSVLYLPNNTVLDASRNLGSWKISSIWDLGKKDISGGKLVAETLTHSTNIPVYDWWDKSFINLLNRSVLKSAIAVFSVDETSIGIIDRIRLFFFCMSLKNDNIDRIDLAETQFVDKTVLSDGEEGYVLTNIIPDKIFLIFSKDFGTEKVFITQIDATKSNSFSVNKIGKTLEVIGIKTTTFNEIEDINIDCKVEGKNQELLEYISNLYECKKIVLNSDSEFDIHLTFGDKFSERY